MRDSFQALEIFREKSTAYLICTWYIQTHECNYLVKARWFSKLNACKILEEHLRMENSSRIFNFKNYHRNSDRNFDCEQGSSAKLVLPAVLGQRRAWREIQNLYVRFVIQKVRNLLLHTASRGFLYSRHGRYPFFRTRFVFKPKFLSKVL